MGLRSDDVRSSWLGFKRLISLRRGCRLWRFQQGLLYRMFVLSLLVFSYKSRLSRHCSNAIFSGGESPTRTSPKGVVCHAIFRWKLLAWHHPNVKFGQAFIALVQTLYLQKNKLEFAKVNKIGLLQVVLRSFWWDGWKMFQTSALTTSSRSFQVKLKWRRWCIHPSN